nr:ribbon-helix-helix domain-containing protein [Candidatus Freyrarchaeum guaymaensis]
MGTLTISLSDEVENKLRSLVGKRGSGKGTMSRIIEDALKMYFFILERGERRFRAYKGEELIAEASDLEELAAKLREKNVDPRGVRIVSSKPVKPVARMGW